MPSLKEWVAVLTYFMPEGQHSKYHAIADFDTKDECWRLAEERAPPGVIPKRVEAMLGCVPKAQLGDYVDLRLQPAPPPAPPQPSLKAWAGALAHFRNDGTQTPFQPLGEFDTNEECWAAIRRLYRPKQFPPNYRKQLQLVGTCTARPEVNDDLALKVAKQRVAKKPTPAPDRLDLDSTTVTGNRELPKVMHVVPWKPPVPADPPPPPISTVLNEALEPLDRDVFRREVDYYEATRSGR